MRWQILSAMDLMVVEARGVVVTEAVVVVGNMVEAKSIMLGAMMSPMPTELQEVGEDNVSYSNISIVW